MPIITMLVTSRVPFSRSAQSLSRSRRHDLDDDLTRGEISHQPLCAGVAECAVQGAADLRGDAQRAAVGLRDIDAFDLMRPLVAVAARQPQQPLAGTVAGGLLGHNLRAVDGETLGER